MRIFAINLHSSTDRRRALLEWLPACDFPWEIFNAVDAREMLPVTLPWTNEDWGDPLWPGAVGCFFSHLRVLQRIVDYGLPWAVVLEDDIRPCSLPVRFTNITLPPVFDVIYLHEMRCDGLASTIVEQGPVFHRVSPSMLTTGAYLVSRRFAEYVCTSVQQVEMPIDHWYRTVSLDSNFRFFELAHPMFRIDGSFPSTISL